LGLLQDPAAIDQQIAREAAEAEAKKLKLRIPTVKTEAQAKAEEAAAFKDKEKGTDKAKAVKPRIRPLSEAKAIDSGANFISETFLFAVALGLIVVENFRSRRKEASRRSDIADKLQELEERDEAMTHALENLRRELSESRATGGSKQPWYWPKAQPEKTPSHSNTSTEPNFLPPKLTTAAADPVSNSTNNSSSTALATESVRDARTGGADNSSQSPG
jgi:myosin-1